MGYRNKATLRERDNLCKALDLVSRQRDMIARDCEEWQATADRYEKALHILAGHLPGHDGCRYARRIAAEALAIEGDRS